MCKIDSGKLLYYTGSPAWSSVTTESSGMGGERGGSRKRGDIHIKVWSCAPGWKPLNSWTVLPGKSDFVYLGPWATLCWLILCVVLKTEGPRSFMLEVYVLVCMTDLLNNSWYQGLVELPFLPVHHITCVVTCPCWNNETLLGEDNCDFSLSFPCKKL